MLTIEVADLYAQQFTVTLSDQDCRIVLRQRSTGLFMDLYVSGVAVVQGVVCKNMVRVVRERYRGFVGDLMFIDTQGGSDPSSPGLGTRFLLQYLEAAEVA